jgi:hypothetical protein
MMSASISLLSTSLKIDQLSVNLFLAIAKIEIFIVLILLHFILWLQDRQALQIGQVQHNLSLMTYTSQYSYMAQKLDLIPTYRDVPMPPCSINNIELRMNNFLHKLIKVFVLSRVFGNDVKATH